MVRHNVMGVKVHDTRLAAAMNIHGVRKILTFNTADFDRFDIEAVHPASLPLFDTPETGPLSTAETSKQRSNR